MGILIASKGREQGMSDRPIDSQGILNMGMPRTTTRVQTEFSQNDRSTQYLDEVGADQ